MLSAQVQRKPDAAQKFGEMLEPIVISKKYTDGERDTLLLAYWELLSDFHRWVHALLQNQFFGSAFALVRPIVENMVRAHIAVMGTAEEVKRLRDDTYKVNFKEIGTKIDAAFGLNHLMENFLNERTREVLHSYTHGGLQQLGRRFREGEVRPNYKDGAIIETIRVATSALFMMTNLLTKHFGFEDDWKKVTEMYLEWGKH
jgi:Family of unknown function (DUF6988)